MIRNVAIVSLSRGLLGEEFVQHEVALGLKRMGEMGLNVSFMPHAQKGLDYVDRHPEARAADLLQALRDPQIDMILCAIGGDDTYRLLPYLFEHGELAAAAAGEKVFLGFSDTTINHFMFHKVGMRTFYGQSFLADLCEIGSEMLPYSEEYFRELVTSGTIRAVRPSELWYESRTDFGPDRMGTPLAAHRDRGFELLQGAAVFSGEILGGCIDSIFDLFDGERHADMPKLCEKYGIFPKKEEWRGKILLLETSEELMPPEKYRRAVSALKERGVFDAVAGVLVGKPVDGRYEREYARILTETVANAEVPIVCNVNIGHAQPRCILPFGVRATVDAGEQVIRFAP